MPEMKPHAVKFSDEDWQTLKALAAELGLTTNALIHSSLRLTVKRHGKQWVGQRKYTRQHNPR